MLDITKRKNIMGVTVRGMIELLSEFNPDAQFQCCGDSYMYIHAEEDGSTVAVDNSSLEDEYYDGFVMLRKSESGELCVTRLEDFPNGL